MKWVGDDRPVRVIGFFFEDLDLGELGCGPVDRRDGAPPVPCERFGRKFCSSKFKLNLRVVLLHDDEIGKSRPCDIWKSKTT